MRAGLSTIQQTLTPEASSILSLSITEAGRRNHGQTTPLHVAATLLASPSGFLRQACVRSHPNSSHPLQCRALELCFSVALERLPTTAAAPDPPISNALMAALKRAQAHQRRGCPEQQQQPLLAVKVELEQLVISILDDPSVSRVMREASFSSPAVKATIEQSLSNSNSQVGLIRPGSSLSNCNRNLYLNPKLQQGSGNNSGQLGKEGGEEIKRVIDVLMRNKKRNPVLVGNSEPESVVRELMRRIEKGEGFGEGEFKNVEVIQVGKKVKELGGVIEARMGRSGGGSVIVDLGDLKWLVEGGSGGDTGREAVAEVAEVVARFGGGGGKVSLIGTATCETYLRCQVYFPSMENDWDLQAVPIASKSPIPGMFPRLGANGIFGSSVGSLTPLKNFPTATTPLLRHISENSDPTRKTICCPHCSENYEQELAKLVANEYEKSSSEVKSEAAQPPLPQWLKNAKVLNTDTKSLDLSQTKGQETVFKQKSQDLLKKWSDACLGLHPNFHHNLSCEKTTPIRLPMAGLYNPNLVVRPQCQLKLQQTRNIGEVLQLNNNPVVNRTSEKPCSPPRSPVGTDLVLGRTKISESAPEHRVKDLLGCISFEPQQYQVTKFANEVDADLFKKLLKGLTGKVWWQREAASQVASAVTNSKFGGGNRRGTGSKGDIWLLFVGPDRLGKKKMASVLSEQICGSHPVTICLGSRRDDEESEMNFRGKTAIDRIAEAVRRNPFSVILLEDIDQADTVVRGSIKRAMERGRLVDSHGREINLGNVIFVVTANGSMDNPENLDSSNVLDEKKLASVASGDWQLRLSVKEKGAKRRADWLQNEDRATKPRKEMGSGLSLDLNLAADYEDYKTDGSLNSSDLSVEHEAEQGLENRLFSIASVPYELINSVNDAIIFKNVEIAPIRREIKTAILEKFSVVVDDKTSIELEDEALEKILGGLWLGRTGLEEWIDKVLVPSFRQLKAQLLSDEIVVVRLESDGGSGSRSTGEWLPSKITVKGGGV
ncbi:protein SUPPRESSOR OF MAX2 1 [Rhododendron vialii]|uniref:protein SUPPRESSOR OF MAX2 1 n=1 Tax=Rhododendron vialii TaxID=182163 RepID=UPI00265F8472|nr:protein SUPPRESSOR OF MAX2 1 [Rhododendron vialii]